MRQLFLIFLVTVFTATFACRRTNNEYVTLALSDPFQTLDTLSSGSSDAAAERVRNLMFNSLVKKNDTFDYVGELARDIKTSADSNTITFTLQDNVKFHNGKEFTSADVKYTLEELFKANGFKAGAFFDTVNDQRVAHIVSLETPDPKTVVITVGRPALKNQLLSNLVAIPIIPEGTAAQQKEHPIGTGPFKFVNFDASQNTVELAANPDYWQGAPKVNKLRVKTVADANSLQAELQTGGVDVVPLPTNLTPDTIRSLATNPNLKVDQFTGSNIQYLVFNTQSAPLNNVKVRQAIGYAIDREKIINELFAGQARIAHSIVPPESSAYAAGVPYTYDPEKAKRLLQEAGYRNEPIVFKYASGSTATDQYSQVIQSSLTAVGLNVQIDKLERNTIIKQMGQGQFQMFTGIWIGGNQDPIFLRDLFTTERIPTDKVFCCNRSRYSNETLDKLVDRAVNAPDRRQGDPFYKEAQEIISRDLPLFPLWYPSNIVVSNKRIGNIKIGASGDWTFVKDITVN